MSRKVYIGRLNDQVRERDVDHFFRGFHVRDIMLKNGYGFVVSAKWLLYQVMQSCTYCQTRCWHVTISCQPDGCLPQPVRPWKSGHVHLAEGSNVVVLDLPYSTEFGRDSREFASRVRKYGKFSHFLTHLVVYGGQGKKYYLLYKYS